MGFRCGIVGLPNVGKSTLFNALTATAAAAAANYPFCTIEPNVGRVAVPDTRLATLARIGKSAKIVPTSLEFVDIAGLVRGASKGEGLGNQFLANIREVDAIAHVLRCFGRLGRGEGVEQGRLADIRQSDDAAGKSHGVRTAQSLEGSPLSFRFGRGFGGLRARVTLFMKPLPLPAMRRGSASAVASTSLATMGCSSLAKFCST